MGAHKLRYSQQSKTMSNAPPRYVQQRLGARPTYKPKPSLQPAAGKRRASADQEDTSVWKRRSEAVAATAVAQHCNSRELATQLLRDRTSWLGITARDMLEATLLPYLVDDARPARPGLMRLPNAKAPPRLRLLPKLPDGVAIYPYDGIDIVYSDGGETPRMTLYSLQFGLDQMRLEIQGTGVFHPGCVLQRGPDMPLLGVGDAIGQVHAEDARRHVLALTVQAPIWPPRLVIDRTLQPAQTLAADCHSWAPGQVLASLTSLSAWAPYVARPMALNVSIPIGAAISARGRMFVLFDHDVCLRRDADLPPWTTPMVRPAHALGSGLTFTVRCVFVVDASPAEADAAVVRPLLASWVPEANGGLRLRGICVDSDERVLIYSDRCLWWYTHDGRLLHTFKPGGADIARVLIMGDGSLLLHDRDGTLRRVV